MSLVKPKYLICSKSFWNLFSDLLESLDYIETFITIDSEWEIENIPKFVKIEPLNEPFETNFFEPVNVTGQVDTAIVLYSSGTTGLPKGVRLSHFNCITYSLPFSFQDSLQTCFIMGFWYFNSDIFTTFKCLSSGMKLVYMNEITVPKILKCIEHFKVNVAMIVPCVIARLAKADLENFNLASLKVIHSRASPLHFKTIVHLKQRIPTLQYITQNYGLTECSEMSSETWTENGVKPGSVGKLLLGVTVKVVCPKSNKIHGPNECGEIRVKGQKLMQGYLGIPIEKCLDDEGFFRTGDMGYYDEEEYLYIIDRIKDVIVHQGYKIAPKELEAILQLHPGVYDVAVVGQPDLIDEHLPTAFIVKQQNCDITAEEIKQYLQKEVPPYMQLYGGVKFIDKIPRNSRNKILRQELRALLLK